MNITAPEYVTDGIAVLAALVAEKTGKPPVGTNVSEHWGTSTFTLRDFCWCDGTHHPDTDDDASSCPPNFEYHGARPLQVEWYKRLGRSVEVSRPVSADEWTSILIDCLLSAKSVQLQEVEW